MPSRSYSSTYRYGYNGKENDGEIKGNGNQYDYGFRIYDPRLGRFLSVDPLIQTYPWYTPYQYASNSPIANIDLDGLEAAGVGFGWGQQQLSNPKASEQTGKALIAMGKGLLKRSWNFVQAINPWDVSDERQNDRARGFGQTVHAITNPTETVQNIKKELKETGRKLMSSDPNEVGDAMAGVTMTLIDLYGGYKAVSSLTRLAIGSGRFVYKTFSTASIRFSQSSINGLEEIVSSMKTNGWKGDPIDIVKMQDDIYTTVDNTRLAAAQLAGIDVKAIAHNFNDVIPEEMAVRFADKKGNLPKTWGEAVKNRIANQNKTFRTNNENGSFVAPTVGSSKKE